MSAGRWSASTCRPYQLLSDVRPPEPCAPGRAAREDYEHTREGTCNLFLSFAPRPGWRRVDVTAHRTALDVAHQFKRLVDGDFPEAEVIRLVLDNPNVHTPAVLYQAFAPADAWRIARKLELHYTPPHGSWRGCPAEQGSRIDSSERSRSGGSSRRRRSW